MDKLNVVVTANIPQEFFKTIEKTDPARIKVTQAGPLFRVERQVAEEQAGKPTEEQAKALKQLEQVMREADVLYTLRLPPNLDKRSPNLKWIQFMSAGVESVREAKNLPASIQVTNASGCHAIPIAEHVMGFMLMLVKESLRSLKNQEARKWERFFPNELAGKTLGIVGLGSIGSEVARLGKCFRMKVTATKRSATKRQANVEGVDEIYAANELKQLMADSDFVVVSVPFTAETTGLIKEPELRAMKKTAFFINIARGKVVDQPTLIKALKEGWIAGAGLDVADPEPLPPESELWSAPNLILTAHISGGTVGTGGRAAQLFSDNLKRFLADKELVNVVDRQRGY